jgi:hypothetical protein
VESSASDLWTCVTFRERIRHSAVKLRFGASLSLGNVWSERGFEAGLGMEGRNGLSANEGSVGRERRAGMGWVGDARLPEQSSEGARERESEEEMGRNRWKRIAECML